MKDVGTRSSPMSNETTLVNTPEIGTPSEDTSAVEDIASETIDKVESVLRAFHEAPTYQQDNHFILRGYRGELNSFKRCFDSLWYVHNETGSRVHFPTLTEVNIWSHLLGAIGFGLLAGFTSFTYLKRYPTSSSADISVFACFFGGAVICLGFSASVRSMASRL
jgi:adiponectin receptor